MQSAGGPNLSRPPLPTDSESLDDATTPEQEEVSDTDEGEDSRRSSAADQDDDFYEDATPSSEHLRLVTPAARMLLTDEDDDDMYHSKPNRSHPMGSYGTSLNTESGDRRGSTRTGDEAAMSVPVLLEGDYFPALPRDVLAELEALDATPDDEGVVLVSGSGGGGSSAATATPSDALHGDTGQLPPNHSSGPTSETASQSLDSASQSSMALPTPPVGSKPRKRLRWADECGSNRTLVHHAVVFMVPSFGVASSATPSAVRPRRSGDDSMMDSNGGPIFRPTTNADRSTYYAARHIRPSARFATWQSTAAALRVAPADLLPSRLSATSTSRTVEGLPPPPAPLSWSMVIESTQRPPATLYARLFPGRPPLAGFLHVPQSQRYETALRSVHFATTESVAQNSCSATAATLDDGGLVIPRIWISNEVVQPTPNDAAGDEDWVRRVLTTRAAIFEGGGDGPLKIPVSRLTSS